MTTIEAEAYEDLKKYLGIKKETKVFLRAHVEVDDEILEKFEVDTRYLRPYLVQKWEEVKRDCISPKGVFEPKGWSHAIRAGKTIYLAGMGGFDEQQKVVEGGFKAQAVKALENMKLTLEAAGASFKDVVKITSIL